MTAPHSDVARSRGSHDLVLGIAQLRPSKGEVERNVAAMRGTIEEWAGRVDIVVFPEAATTGYFLEGGVREGALTPDALADAFLRPPLDAPDVVLGFFEDRRGHVYNSAVHLTPGEDTWEVVHVHRKVFLPTYGVFQEARFVEPGTEVRAYDTRFGRLGLLVCEDAWHSVPPAILALDGADLILVPSASPARDFGPGGAGLPGNLVRWDALGAGIAREHGVFVAISQLVGSEGGKLFPGGATVFGPDGVLIDRGPLLEEGVIQTGLDVNAIARARARAPLLADLEERLPVLERELRRAAGMLDDRSTSMGNGEAPARAARLGRAGATSRRARPTIPRDDGAIALPGGVLEIDAALIERTLVEFIRDEVRGRGFERVVLGVSGGVDSAVSLVLATRALGPENVHGFRLPYATSSAESLEHAGMVLEMTGAVSHTIPITGPVDALIATLESPPSPLRKGNFAARTRAVILFDQSARLRALPIGTGNKSERLLGYFTWHADDSPPVNPLGDLFKTQVWALARHLGVPAEIVEKPASADLVRGVHDEDELGISYHRADPILHWLLEGYSDEELVDAGFPSEEVSLVRRRLDSTHWKRELPTVAMLSSSAIGEAYLRPVDYLARRGVEARGPAAAGAGGPAGEED